MTGVVQEEITYQMTTGGTAGDPSTGVIKIIFNGLPHTTIQNLIKTVHTLCIAVSTGGLDVAEPTTTANKKKTPHEKKEKSNPPEKPLGPVPKIDVHATGWEYRFIKMAPDLDMLLKAFFEKFKKTKMSKENITTLWEYWHPKSADQQVAETPAPRTSEDPQPGKQIGMNSKVVQIAGDAPGIGIGTVTEELKDGRIKVQFFNHIKVLPRLNFALATEEDIRKAGAIANGQGKKN